MSELSAFMNPVYTEKKIEVIIGDRFLGEDGKPIPVIMKSLTQEKMQEIAKRSTHEKRVNGKIVSEMDAIEHLNRCLVASVISPDLTNRDLCNAYKTEDPVQLPSKMFLVDEYEKLAKAFAKLNGINSDDSDSEILGDVSKN